MDLNSDLGESYGAWRMGDDAAILALVTSANVACGFHAGDPAGILETLTHAATHGVAVGAHVSYPDLVGFGRRNMDPTSRELVADVIYQIGALQAMAAYADAKVCQAARRAVQHHCARPPPGQRRDRRHPGGGPGPRSDGPGGFAHPRLGA